MKNGIHAIIFDLGNVLLTLDWDRMVRRFSEATGRSCDELNHHVDHTEWSGKHGRGEISSLEFYEIAAQAIGFRGGYAEFAALYSDMFDHNEPMLDLARNLKGRILRLVLSNTNAIHMQHIFRRFPELYDLDGFVLSHELGVEKPDPRIYRHTLQRYGLDPAATVFIDDLERNVQGARRAGMRTVHYRNADQARQELTALGVEVI